MSYWSKSSGCLTGGGTRRSRVRRSVIRGHALRHQIPDIHITDKKAVREQVWDFDPLWEFEYSERELMLMTEKILLDDLKPFWEPPYWLPAAQCMNRMRHEIYTANGTPDPAIASGLYWRTHPQGRKFNTGTTQAEGGHSFYS